MHPSSRRITQREIARQAGVHVSTVSLALRNSPKIPVPTRTKVQSIAHELGYCHDAFLDALVSYREQERRRQSPSIIAYVTNWEIPIREVHHHAQILTGARTRAEALGFRLEHFSLAAGGISPRRLDTILATRGINAVIVSSFSHGAERLDLAWEAFSGVRIGLQPKWPPLDAIAVDHLDAIRQCCLQAQARGYTKPGLVIGHNWSRLVDDHWEMGFEWTSRKLGLEAVPVCGFEQPLRGSPQAAAFDAWYAEHQPDVILAPHAVAADRAARLGLQIGTDLPIIDPFLEASDPFFAGVVHPLHDVGERAIDELIGMITRNERGLPVAPACTFVGGTWHDGASCPSQGHSAGHHPRSTV